MDGLQESFMREGTRRRDMETNEQGDLRMRITIVGFSYVAVLLARNNEVTAIRSPQNHLMRKATDCLHSLFLYLYQTQSSWNGELYGTV